MGRYRRTILFVELLAAVPPFLVWSQDHPKLNRYYRYPISNACRRQIITIDAVMKIGLRFAERSSGPNAADRITGAPVRSRLITEDVLNLRMEYAVDLKPKAVKDLRRNGEA